MKATSLSAIVCASILAMNLAIVDNSAYADDADTGVTTDEQVVDPIVDDTIVDEPEVAVTDVEPDYDPIIAQSGVPTVMPNQRNKPGGLDSTDSHSEGGSEDSLSFTGSKKKWNGKGARPSLFGSNSPLRDWFKKMAAK